jgi:hypothetical protein
MIQNSKLEIYKRREQGIGNTGTDKKQKLLSLKLSQKKDVF